MNVPRGRFRSDSSPTRRGLRGPSRPTRFANRPRRRRFRAIACHRRVPHRRHHGVARSAVEPAPTPRTARGSSRPCRCPHSIRYTSRSRGGPVSSPSWPNPERGAIEHVRLAAPPCPERARIGCGVRRFADHGGTRHRLDPGSPANCRRSVAVRRRRTKRKPSNAGIAGSSGTTGELSKPAKLIAAAEAAISDDAALAATRLGILKHLDEFGGMPFVPEDERDLDQRADRFDPWLSTCPGL